MWRMSPPPPKPETPRIQAASLVSPLSQNAGSIAPNAVPLKLRAPLKGQKRRRQALYGRARSFLDEQDAIIIVRPIGDGLFQLQPCRGQLLDQHLLRNSVPSAICRDAFHGIDAPARRTVDNRQPTS